MNIGKQPGVVIWILPGFLMPCWIQNGPQQWPCPEGSVHGKVRLYEDGVFPTASGRACFANAQYLQPARAN